MQSVWQRSIRNLILVAILFGGAIVGVILGSTFKKAKTPREIPKAQVPSHELVADNMLFSTRLGEYFPPLTVKYFNGDLGKISDFYSGRIIILFFWSPGCPGCVKQAEVWREAVHPRLRGNAEVIVCIDHADKRTFDKYDHLFPEATVVFTDQTKFHEDHNLSVLPTIFVLAGNGIIMHIQYGQPSKFDEGLIRIIIAD